MYWRGIVGRNAMHRQLIREFNRSEVGRKNFISSTNPQYPALLDGKEQYELSFVAWMCRDGWNCKRIFFLLWMWCLDKLLLHRWLLDVFSGPNTRWWMLCWISDSFKWHKTTKLNFFTRWPFLNKNFDKTSWFRWFQLEWRPDCWIFWKSIISIGEIASVTFLMSTMICWERKWAHPSICKKLARISWSES